MKKEFEAVRLLGEEIGYGNMMSIASALWRKSLKEQGYPESGAFVPTCFGLFDAEGEEIAKASAVQYDSLLNNALNKEKP